MPQGTVIAVRPISFASEPVLMNASLTEAPGTTRTRSTGETSAAANLLYIEVYEGKLKSRATGKVKSVVWYEDTKCEFSVGD